MATVVILCICLTYVHEVKILQKNRVNDKPGVKFDFVCMCAG